MDLTYRLIVQTEIETPLKCHCAVSGRHRELVCSNERVRQRRIGRSTYLPSLAQDRRGRAREPGKVSQTGSGQLNRIELGWKTMAYATDTTE